MKFLIEILLIYVVLVAIVFVFQRSLIYYPDNNKPVAPEGVDAVSVQTSDGLSIGGWFIKAEGEEKGVIAFFHGNAGHHGYRLFKAARFYESGYSVLLAGYRGYSGNEGSPSEQGFYNDARAYISYLKNEKGYENSDIVLYGESIGTGVAVQMASENVDMRALILETPYSELADIGAQAYFFLPVRLLLKDRYASINKVSSLKMPVLVLHGHNDETVPFESAKKLYDVIGSERKSFIEFPQGMHNNLYNHGAFEHIAQFLERFEQSEVKE